MKTRTRFLIALLMLWPIAPAQATTLVRLSLEQLTQAATEIVRGHVVSQESHWNADHTQIVTLTTFAVEDSMKGHPTATMVVEQLGGVVGNIHEQVAGNVVFRPQQSYMLFLEPTASDSTRFSVVGMRQGSFPIYRDAITHEERVILPMGLSSSSPAPKGSGAPGTVSIGEFRQDLSAALTTPVVIPRGTSIPLIIESTESRGVGRLHVTGRTTANLYPSSTAVIPAGSTIEGSAELVSGEWRIHWIEISVRGTRVALDATGVEPSGRLRGRTMVANTR